MTRGGYEQIDDHDEGSPQTVLQMTQEDRVKLASVRGILALLGVIGCLFGQVLQWTQTDEWCKMFEVYDNETACEIDGALRLRVNESGTYALFLVILCGVNLYSYLRARPDLLWCSAVFMFEVFDKVVRDATRASDHSADVLLASYVFCIVGTVLTFAVYPMGSENFAQLRADLKNAGLSRITFAFVILLVLVIGSIVLWASTSSHDRVDDVHVSAALVGLFYFMSVTSNSVSGQELCFIYMAISIAKYEPFSRGEFGFIMVFSALVLTCLYHLAVDCLGTSIRQWAPSGLLQKGKLGYQGVCLLMAVVGGFVVMFSHRTGTGRREHHPGARECWVVVTMMLVCLFMSIVERTRNTAVAVFAMSLMISVMNEAVNYINDAHTAGGSSATRVGYILLFLGSMMSFLGLPVRWNTSMSTARATDLIQDAETKPYVQSALAIFCSVAYLWSESSYEGALGFFAIAMLIAATHSFVQGLQWCYLVSLLFLPRLTPFTAAPSGSDGTPYTSVDKIAILVCFFALLNTIYYHVHKFGVCAFTELRLFTLREEPVVVVDDDEEVPGEAQVHPPPTLSAPRAEVEEVVIPHEE